MLHHGRRRAVFLRKNLVKCHPFGFLILKSQRLSSFLYFFVVFQHLLRFNFPQAKNLVYRSVIWPFPGNKSAIRVSFQNKQNLIADSLFCVCHQISHVVKGSVVIRFISIQMGRVLLFQRDWWLNEKERIAALRIFPPFHKYLLPSSVCDEFSWTLAFNIQQESVGHCCQIFVGEDLNCFWSRAPLIFYSFNFHFWAVILLVDFVSLLHTRVSFIGWVSFLGCNWFEFYCGAICSWSFCKKLFTFNRLFIFF